MPETPPPVRVLHVDDEPDFAETAVELLAREDSSLEVEMETDPAAALERIERNDIDCVVSDFDMPGFDGLELLEAVREDHPDLPFILFTGKGSEEIASEAISAGVTDYLQKGSGTERYAMLVNRIRNAVERRQAREAVEETEAWARTLLAHSSDYLFVVDETGTISYVSPSVERVLGYSPDEVVGESAFQFVHPDDVEGAAETFATALDAADDEPMTEFRALDADGEVRWLEVRGRNLLDDPTVGGVLVNARDVTDRHDLEAELEATLSQYRTLVEQNVAGIYILKDGGWAYANPRACEIVGYSLPELRGMDDAISIVTEEHRDEVRRNIRDRLEGEVDEVDYRLTIERGGDGERRDLRVHGRRIEYEGGPAIMGTVVDVTELRERERELERSEARYQALLRHSHDAIARIEFDHEDRPIVREVNDAFDALFVPDGEDAVARDIDELVAGGSRREEAREISRRVREGESMSGRITRDTVDGPREFLWRAVPIDDPAAGPIESGFAIYTELTAEHPVD